MPVDEVKKKHRGFFDHVCNGTVYVCRWNDNAVVTLASNHLTHHPTGSVQRYSQSQKKHTGRRAHPPETLRITQGHYLEPISQGRCRDCKKNCRLHCVECRERLHRKCFPLYHRIST
ncbi:PiggyBac transposable element-derived protein 3 [Trichinella patagoniensis]|uniref:PiggyBac transposable element-derived protein 3 n=1 Tax=Trichinella patagoniensis TaxID=990121 RepID=A0A0V0ZZT8_9BILA|nr:PiggyBac transposable element-derived protein 3 [Trichinella patagoniensis]